jgi:CheY-like chemotaxis protein
MRTHILLIDDDGDELELLCNALDLAGINHRCTLAPGLARALRVLESLEPHVIFIDFNMPVADGMQAIATIRNMEKFRTVPVVLYSNAISDETRAKALALGATACIEKPSTLTELSEIMKSFFASIAADKPKKNNGWTLG